MANLTCFIHFGTGKAGSSAIQSLLHRTRGALAGQGLCYPDVSENFDQVEQGTPTSGNGIALLKLLKEDGSAGSALQLLDMHLDREASVILSCEGFWHLPGAVLQNFVQGLAERGYRTKGLVCFRDQCEFIVSRWLQNHKEQPVKDHPGLDQFIMQWLDSPREPWNWYRCAENLSSVMGPTNLSVLWYPWFRSLGRDALVTAVVQWLGYDGPAEPESSRAINPSPNQEAMQVIRLLHQLGWNNRKVAYEFLSRAQSAGLLAGGRPAPSRNTLEHLKSRCAPSNEQLLAKWAPGHRVSWDQQCQVSEAEELRGDVLLRQLHLLPALLQDFEHVAPPVNSGKRSSGSLGIRQVLVNGITRLRSAVSGRTT